MRGKHRHATRQRLARVLRRSGDRAVLRQRDELNVLNQCELLLQHVRVALVHAAGVEISMRVADVNIAGGHAARRRLGLRHQHRRGRSVGGGVIDHGSRRRHHRRDYLYTSENALGMTRASSYAPVAILGERMDAATNTPRHEYAWLRIDRAAAGREPVALRTTPPLLHEPLAVVSTTEGAPLKVDAAVRVVDARPSFGDFFVADSDTFHGSSGGGAFDENGALLGVLARGAADYEASGERDCAAPNRLASGDAAEEFSWIGPALQALCATPLDDCPAICEGACPERPGLASGEVVRGRASRAGCAFSPRAATCELTFVLFLVIAGAASPRRWQAGQSRRRCRAQNQIQDHEPLRCSGLF